MIGIDDLRHDALALPEAAEGTHFGLPSFEVRGTTFVTLQKGDTHAIAHVSPAEAEALAADEPEVFEVVRRNDGTIFVGVRIDLARVGRARFAEVVGHAWRHRAPKRLVAEHPEAGDPLPAGLASPVQRALHGAGYTSLGQLTSVSERELGSLRGVGPSAIRQLRRQLTLTDRTFAAG